MSNNTTTTLSIKLNNFLHRIDCKATLIALVNQHGCSLKRIRRSKNWSLTGQQSQLIKIGEELHQSKTVWITEAINKGLPKPSFDLVAIALSDPGMTINRLIAETGCTLIEARIAIDKAEDLL
ncbi:ribosome recycling factor family protein [Psychromonas sp. GE-S-Ul-11]|uniref:ribosome recycling factor family protein n=1 Tax=Psychromonas sp. GE-S-Ul-11 TaxID=3241170 RepID=UPI00390C4981